MKAISYWIDKRAQITPERVALIGDGRRLTYGEMAGQMNQISRALADHYQLQQGERVAILASNGIEYLLLLFSCAKLGCIIVPLNTRLTTAELQFQLEDSGTSVLIVGSAFIEKGYELKHSSSIRHLILLDCADNQAESLGHICTSYSSSYLAPASHEMNTPYLICYTSGTTGRPKGAVLTQENMYWNAVNNILALDITSADRILTLLPLFHIGGIGLFTFPAFLAGATVIIPPRFDPEETLTSIATEQVTVMMSVPTILDMLRKSPSFPTTDFSDLRWIVSGGAPCPAEIIQFYHDRGIPLGQGYGLTETSPTVFMLSKEDYQRKLGSIGKPAMFCDIRIVDQEGKDILPGEVGELLVRGPNVIREYWQLPEETGKSFKDGWFNTGDLVKQDDEGFVYIAGRKKEMIISGGENIYPLEIEQLLEAHHAITEAAVIGVQDDRWGEVPLAIVALKEGITVTATQLTEYCLHNLAKYKCPKHFEFVSALPKNATGKVDKAALKKTYTTV